MRTLCLLVVFSVLLPRAEAGVLTVGGSAPTHPNLQAAVTAAVDGDVILVRSFVSQNVVVTGKGVSIVADGPAHMAWGGTIDIQNVPAGSTMLVAGFDFSSLPLRVTGCSGAVRLQDVRAVNPSSFPAYSGSVVECSNSTDVALTRCTITGASSSLSGFPPPFGVQNEGVRVQSSTVAIHDSIITGGNGHAGTLLMGPTPLDGGDGSMALLVFGSSVVFASGSTFQGGAGGNGADGTIPPPTCVTTNNYPTFGGYGGDAVWIEGGSSGSGAGNALIGGNGGQNGVTQCAPTPTYSPSGAPFSGPGGPWVELSTVARKIEVQNLTRESTNLAITFRGAPGERVFLTSTAQPAHVSSTLLQGVFLGLGPYRRLSPGFLDAQGVLQISLAIGDLGPGVDEDVRHLQCVMLDANGQPHLGSASVLTLVDAAY